MRPLISPTAVATQKNAGSGREQRTAVRWCTCAGAPPPAGRGRARQSGHTRIIWGGSVLDYLGRPRWSVHYQRRRILPLISLVSSPTVVCCLYGGAAAAALATVFSYGQPRDYTEEAGGASTARHSHIDNPALAQLGSAGKFVGFGLHSSSRGRRYSCPSKLRWLHLDSLYLSK